MALFPIVNYFDAILLEWWTTPMQFQLGWRLPESVALFLLSFVWSDSIIHIWAALGEERVFFPELRQVKGLLSHRQLWTLRLTRTLFQHDGIRHPEVHPLFLNCNSEPEVRTASMSRLTEEDTTLGLAVGISAGFEMQHSLLVRVAKWRIFF